jgi:hypothetical protein
MRGKPAVPWTAFAGEDAAADTREHHRLVEYPATLIRDIGAAQCNGRRTWSAVDQSSRGDQHKFEFRIPDTVLVFSF